jgi:hypothetical protein
LTLFTIEEKTTHIFLPFFFLFLFLQEHSKYLSEEERFSSGDKIEKLIVLSLV